MSAPVNELEVTVGDVRRAIDAGEGPLLVDCRRDDEVAIAKLDGAIHVPMERIELDAESIEEASAGRPIVVYCHHGVRSLTAMMQLREAGLKDVRSMRGGIDLWSVEIDPAITRY